MYNELLHYGVKGMKWGVRRYDYVPVGRNSRFRTDEESREISRQKARGKRVAGESAASSILSKIKKPSLNEEQKKRLKLAGAIGIGAAVAVGAGVAFNVASHKYSVLMTQKLGSYSRAQYMSKAKKLADGTLEYNTPVSGLSSQDTIIPSGTQFNRIAKSIKPFDQREISEMYVTKTSEDAKRYVGNLFGHKLGIKRQYTLQATTDLRAPSEQKRMRYFMSMLNSDADFKSAFMKDHKLDTIDTKNMRQYYWEFSKSLGNWEHSANKMYFDKIRKEGYNALLDELDSGSYGRNPLIILDPKGTTAQIGYRRVSLLETWMTRMTMKPLQKEW